MKKEELCMKNEIEKESIALFKKNLLKESYNWFKDTDYFAKLKNENRYSYIENKTETKNIVTGRVQLGWGGTFFLLCCVVVICDNSGWQSCNHYNNNIFYSPESLTIVYSFLYIVYAFPLFIFHQCLGLVSQGNYVKSCRMLSPHMGILSIFSLFGTITFCAKEICNFSIELLQNIIRLSNRREERKFGMTKLFIDLTNREKDCSSLPNTVYIESLNQCISFNDEVIVNFYENLWFISNKENYIYLILISTIFIFFCYFLLLKENFRVFKFFIFVIIINWITTKSVVIMNAFFFYIPQQKKIYEEIILIFKEVGFVKLTIFLYGTLARSSSIFILSTFASYFHTNTNILKISLYTFAFYILNMYFYLKNEAHEYYLYNLNFTNIKNFNFMKCNTYANMLHTLSEGTKRGKYFFPKKYGDMYAVWQKLCLFFSSYSFLFSTIFIVLMQLLGPFNILYEKKRKKNSCTYNSDQEKKIYSYKSLVKKYEKLDSMRSTAMSNGKSGPSSSFSSNRKRNTTTKKYSNRNKESNRVSNNSGWKKIFPLNVNFLKKKKKKNSEQVKQIYQQRQRTSSSRKTISFKGIKKDGEKRRKRRTRRMKGEEHGQTRRKREEKRRRKEQKRQKYEKNERRKEHNGRRQSTESSYYMSRQSSLFISEYSKNDSLATSPKRAQIRSYDYYYGDRVNLNSEESFFEKDMHTVRNELDSHQMKYMNGGKLEAIYTQADIDNNAASNGSYSDCYTVSSSTDFSNDSSAASSSASSSASSPGMEKRVQSDEGQSRTSTEKVRGKNMGMNSSELLKKKQENYNEEGTICWGLENKKKGSTNIFSNSATIFTSNFISKINNNMLKNYGTFLLFLVIYIFTILHIVDFKRNNNIVSEIILYSLYRSFLIFIISVQIIYSSWFFGLRIQMTQCGIISCILNFITWIIILPLMFIIYLKKKNIWIDLLIIGIILNIITILTSYVEVMKKIKERKLRNLNDYNNCILTEYNKVNILKKCLYWLYIGNLEILRKNMNIAMSGSEQKYIPFFWNFFFKYVNSSMLIVIIIYNTKEYFIDMLDVFDSTFSFTIELISILMIFLGSFALLLNNLLKDHYKPQKIVIPSTPMFCHDKRKYIFTD
ncbi:hypothetical protein, conserved [Plasmodium malariae]|uniref:Transporter n=1 Tax=Plasmodium malariae TaxID=5858 RepID=A0A1A8WX25_PLAMA|nr:hypothetical protein, conserved [Plasmodium malariae]